jgi:AAA+ superfamily predicted ATPase
MRQVPNKDDIDFGAGAKLSESIGRAVADVSHRWIFIDGITANETGHLARILSGLLKDGHSWFPVDVISNAYDRTMVQHSPQRWLVVDTLQANDPIQLLRQLKFLLYAFPEKRLIAVGDGSLQPIHLPTYLGRGICVNAQIQNSAKDDTLLLQHSRRILPKYTFSDLVLSPKTEMKFVEAIQYIMTKQKCETQWGFRERHSRGHGVTLLFHGPSGTGKTMAAEVVAHNVNMPLYQIDLSSVVSKWVGETEKNLKSIFRSAQGVDGILLFDEGDAMFGQRTKVEGSQDRHSNMEVNFLLQEIESFDGIVILSTNHEKSVDPAFLRRFTYGITFAPPDHLQRARIWRNNIPAKLPLMDDVDLERLSVMQLTGGKIKNCIRHAAARAMAMGKPGLFHEDFLWAIKREQQKHGESLERLQVGEDYWRKVAPEWEHLHFKKEIKDESKPVSQ